MKRFFHSFAYALVFVFGLAACDAAGPDDTTTLDDAELRAVVTELSTDLDLSATQASAVQASFAQHQTGDRQPGYLWYVAADLQQALTDEEKARLFAKAETQRARFEERRESQDGPRHRRDRRGPGAMHLLRGRLASELGLTDDQKTDIQAIMESRKDNFKALHTSYRNGDLTQEQLRNEMASLRADIEAEVEATLTPEQQAKLAEIKQQRADRRDERKDNRRDRRDANHTAMVDVLELTQTQQDALATLKAEQHAKAAEIREQVQNGSLDREGAQAAMQTLHEEGQASRAALLTGTQQEILNIHRALTQRVMAHKAKQRLQQRGQPQQG